MGQTKSIPKEHIVQTHERFIYPIARVVAPGSKGIVGGSGIVVYSAAVGPKSKEHESYLLTNHHVIAGLISVEKVWDTKIGRNVMKETRSEAMAEFFEYENLSHIVEAGAKRAEVVAWDEPKDLGLLRLKSTVKVEHVAPIMKPADAEKKLFISTPVYTVGCGLGVPPLLTSGHIGGFDFMIDNYPYTLTTAPAIFGNSGGAVTLQETGEVIGVTARIAVAFTGFGGTPITHMQWSISAQTIYDFLDEQIFDFVINSKRTSAECAKERKVLKEKAYEAMVGGAPDADEGLQDIGVDDEPS